MTNSNTESQTKTSHHDLLSSEQRQLVVNAVNAGIEDYIQNRKAKVPAFVIEHFSFYGALKLHRKALGKDLYKTPLNVLWLAPLAVIKTGAWLSEKSGATKIAEKLNKLPSGLETDVQREINWLIYTELLELPYQQQDRSSGKDALLEAILRDPQLSRLIDSYLTEIHQKSNDPNFRQTLEKNLQTYASSRAVAAEIAGNVLTLCSSYAAFQQMTPGALSSGSATAALIAQKIAISQFWLGPTLGSWYYGLFPVAASTGLIIATTGAIMAGLGIIASFSGIITDPLQAKLGLHQKRLNKFIDALAVEMRNKDSEPYKIKEIYASRIFDIVDVLTLALRSGA